VRRSRVRRPDAGPDRLDRGVGGAAATVSDRFQAASSTALATCSRRALLLLLFLPCLHRCQAASGGAGTTRKVAGQRPRVRPCTVPGDLVGRTSGCRNEKLSCLRAPVIRTGSSFPRAARCCCCCCSLIDPPPAASDTVAMRESGACFNRAKVVWLRREAAHRDPETAAGTPPHPSKCSSSEAQGRANGPLGCRPSIPLQKQHAY
jgi:hypothetical protein